MSFTESDKTKILRLKSAIASYYTLQMKKIGDKQLESYFFSNGIIAGGCISSLFHDEPVNDIDVYAKDAYSMAMIKDHILLKGKNIKSFARYEFDSDGNKVIVDVDKPIPAVTDNAVTLTNDVQFIYMHTWDRAQASFDFIHCMPYYDIGSQRLYISEAQYNAIKNKILIPNGSQTSTARRLKKYTERGWSIQKEIQPMGYKWNDTEIGMISREIAGTLNMPHDTMEQLKALSIYSPSS